MKKEYPQVACGAVYFRKSDPPREDWERDYAQARMDGMNMFRHWFLWNAIEKAPGEYDWSEYDRQLELAAANGIGTIIAEFSDCVPEWFYHEHKDCFSVLRDFGRGYDVQAPFSGQGGSCNTGGFVPGGPCLDNDKARGYIEGFLRALAGHYKDHPGLFGYDVWNECNYSPAACFCEHTQARFRVWLQKKYGSLEALGEAWHRYSYTSWDQVQAPRFETPCAECLDWLFFRKQNFYENYRWKVSIIESVDKNARITAHGVAASLDYTYGDGNDDWMAASNVESYGLTWVMGRKGTEPWKQWHAIDLVRAGSRGKTFWHAEMQGGALWLQPQVLGRAKEDGRVGTAEDIRLWNLVSLAGGARGVMYLRWRSLLGGPLFSSFGLYGNDGLPNDRSKMNAAVAKWANSAETKGLFAAQPVKSTVGLIVLDQIQEFNRLVFQAGKEKFYANCQWGAYRMFFESGIPVDWVHFDDIGQYKTLYFAYPILLEKAHAAKLADWVKNGGRLICEGLPGYFTDGGRVCTVQPGNGLDKVFGVNEKTVEFMPDLSESIKFGALGISDIPGGYFRQSYEAAGADVLGEYPDGEAAVLRNKYGEGETLLIGTFPSAGYQRTSSQLCRLLLNKLVALAGAAPPSILSGSDKVNYRLCEDGPDKYVWLINHGNGGARVNFRTEGMSEITKILWGKLDCAKFSDGCVTAYVPGKDAVVLQIK